MSKLTMGIVGLPNVGKSTLFNILTQNEADAQNYPFCTIDPNVGVVAVPDERLKKLSEMSASAKTIPAVVEFYDIAGLVKGANKGEGLGNQFLNHIRETDAIVMVLRVFQDDGVIHVENSVDPVRDMDIINMELALKDLETMERAFDKIEGEAKTGNKDAIKMRDAAKRVRDALASGENIASEQFGEEMELVRKRGLRLLSDKKQLYLLNGDEEDVSGDLKKKIADRGSEYVVCNLGLADEVPELITGAYKTLDLISFFTTGEKESRAWTTPRGSKAPRAAGVIHSDFEDKFIRAEVIHWEKLLEAGSWSAARQKGWLRIEGKDYEVQDGDVMVIRHG